MKHHFSNNNFGCLLSGEQEGGDEVIRKERKESQLTDGNHVHK